MRIGMDTPVSIGVLVTFAVSTAATYDPSGPWGQDIWFDSLTMLVFFLLGGRYLEAKARTRTAGALDALLTRLPESCERQHADGTWQRVSARRLQAGDVVRLQAGQSFPGDGVLLSDAATVDEALLTGEALPVARTRGQALIAGSRNLRGMVTMRVSAMGQTTRFAQIVKLMERAMIEKPRLAVMADRIAGPFLLGVLALAGAVGWYWWGVDPSRALSSAVAVLIVTCPCALSLATPAAMLSATAALARQGVLVQRVQALEALGQVDAVVFDKTGTLTSERPEIIAIVTREGTSAEAALLAAAQLARGSAHPLSHALLAAAPAAVLQEWSGWEELPGRGVQAQDPQGQTWRLGALAWCGAAMPQDHQQAVHVALADGAGWLATFVFDESLREDAANTVQTMQTLGWQVHMLSGDHAGAVQHVATHLGVDSYQAGITPEGKTQAIEQWQQQGRRVMMVGDGLNDAPVLSQANVSVAMGSGAALAQSQADVIVQSGRLGDLLVLHSVALRTARVVRQNLTWALAYNLVAIPLASAGWMPPWVAGLGMAASSLVVVLNALRLRRLR